jgi:MoxR-like ATPase
MSDKAKYTTEEVATYLAGRLKPRGQAEAQGRDPDPAEQAASSERPETEVARLADELSGLVLEKQDLIRQIVSDGHLLGRSTDASRGQEDLLNALDALDNAENADLRRLLRDVGPDQGLEGSIKAAGDRLEDITHRIARLATDDRLVAAYTKRIGEKIGLIRVARTVDALRGLIEKTELAEMQLVARRNAEDLTLSAADRETMIGYDRIRQKAKDRIGELMGREEVYYEARRRGLLEYRRQLMNGGFVKTESVRAGIMRILSHVQLGIPVFLRGHLGVGKTEMALHVSRAYLGHEPEFISGSEEATKYDIYGRTQIGVGAEQDRMQEFRKRIAEYRRMYPDADERDLKEIEREYYQAIVIRGQATSFFQYGPLVRAMKEGRPLIIDEMDGIPHSILMRINHVLTRRAGDRIRVQENGGEEIAVKKGFCVLATGNVKSARYKREELDAAFLSRWWSEDITYPPAHETYEILLAALVDRRGNLQVNDPGTLVDLKRLTEAAGEIQRIFTGDQLDFLGEGADAARGTPAGLKKTVLSLRHLWNIVKPWKARHFDRSLEHYIMDEFIRPAVAEDQVYLVQLFCRFRFFKSWTIDQFEIPGLTEAKLLAFQGRQAV